jgi:hypothetical protein
MHRRLSSEVCLREMGASGGRKQRGIRSRRALSCVNERPVYRTFVFLLSVRDLTIDF